MVDYQKLYIDLSNQITEAINILKNAQEQAFEDFVSSDPSKEEVMKIAAELQFPRFSAYKLK